MMQVGDRKQGINKCWPKVDLKYCHPYHVHCNYNAVTSSVFKRPSLLSLGQNKFTLVL